METNTRLRVYLTSSEIKNTLFAMPKGKSSGLDGLTVEILIQQWVIIWNDLVATILHFFRTRWMLRAMNHALLTLIPKNNMPFSLDQYRPISCLGVAVGRRELELFTSDGVIIESMLAFADGVVFCCRVSKKSIRALKEIMEDFTTFSGLEINTDKSFAIFSSRVDDGAELRTNWVSQSRICQSPIWGHQSSRSR